YKVAASGEKSVFFDPKTKYIWDLAFASDGTLYVATGDKGQIFGVSPDGKGEVLYASDEAHIRVLAVGNNSALYAGTEPSGRILRLTRAAGGKPAEGFVVYETTKREVTSLAVAPDGAIYASAIGEKTKPVAAPSTVVVTPQGTATISTGVSGITVSGGPGQSPF